MGEAGPVGDARALFTGLADSQTSSFWGADHAAFNLVATLSFAFRCNGGGRSGQFQSG